MLNGGSSAATGTITRRFFCDTGGCFSQDAFAAATDINGGAMLGETTRELYAKSTATSDDQDAFIGVGGWLKGMLSHEPCLRGRASIRQHVFRCIVSTASLQNLLYE
jgi:hypothetical protein